MIYTYKETTELTNIAKNIFGDIVESVSIEYYDEDALEHQISKIIEQSTEQTLQYDSQTIMIKFINGKSVIFTNSEWGSINTYIE